MDEKNKETITVEIELPKKLYELICGMAKMANKELDTRLTGNEMISKLAVQYFGTKNSLDIMAFSLEKFPKLLIEEKEDIFNFGKTFQELAFQLDDISKKSNTLFHKVIDKLETLQ